MNSYLLVLVAILAAANPFSALAVDWTGKVVGVSDGDTLTVMRAGRGTKVRLVEIDAPESRQDYGQRSKQSLSDLCFGKEAKVEDKGTDKYRRTLGRVFCAGVDANAEQIRRGMAWAYRQYLTDQSLLALEETAKAGKVGLWAQENPTPPWEYRHGGQTKPAAETPEIPIIDTGDTGASGKFKCGGKTKCGQMDSCEEARFYLEKCGLTRLDRDRDGVPCESLCR